MKKPLISAFLLALAMTFTGVTASAQGGGAPGLERHFVRPKLLMKHQAKLQLTDVQKEEIKTAIKKAQSRSTDLEFALQEEVEKLVTIVSQPKVNKKKALAQSDKVMKLEAELKKVRLTLLIETKNTLTSEQLKQVADHRKKMKRRDRKQRKDRPDRKKPAR